MPKRSKAGTAGTAAFARRRAGGDARPALALAMAAALLLASCKRTPPPRAAHGASPRELGLELERAARAAGGEGVWVKGAANGEFPPRQAAEPVEAVATPSAFAAVTSALEREAAARGARAEASRPAGARGARELEIRFGRGNEVLEIWKLREVREIGRAAILIDDLGANPKAAEKLLALPYALTFSVLPNLRYSVATAEAAHRAGREVMLHLPMEPIPRPGFMPKPGEVREGMDREQVYRLVEADLGAVPYVRGVNNHEGSLATQDRRLMEDVMQVLAARRLFFIDSRTSGASVALGAARGAGLPSFYRSVFLDDTASVKYTLGQLEKFRGIVEKQGVALAIGHPHATTIRALEEFLPKLREDDIELVPASRLVILPEAARLEPEEAAEQNPGVRSQKPEF